MHCPSNKKGYMVYHNSAVHGDSSDDNTTSDNSSCTGYDERVNISLSQESNPMSDALITQLMIRNSINQQTYNLPWPLTSGHINLHSFEQSVPEELIVFISGLIETRSGMPIPHTDKIKVLSICQDLVSLLSKNMLTTPKALSLGLTIKNLTGSKELINILHRLGHCPSYDSIRTYETSLAHHLNRNRDSIPEGFAHGSLIVMVWGNIDHLEATKSGHNTTHNTNGIMMQLTHQIPKPKLDNRSLWRGQGRSLQPETVVIDSLTSHSKISPTHLSGISIPEAENLSLAQAAEFVFALVRFQEEIVKPSWTGFKKLTQAHHAAPCSVLKCLPVVAAPPTDEDAVNHVLQRSIEMADRFGISSAVVVFDLAIDCKAQRSDYKTPSSKQG